MEAPPIHLDQSGKSWLRSHSVAVFYLLALGFSWLVELPLVAMRQGWMNLPIPYVAHYLASFGPALASILMTAATGGEAGLRELWGRVARWRVGWRWALFAAGSPLLFFLVGLPIVRLALGVWPDLRLLGQANYLPYLGAWVLPLWLITFGFGEEIGWRGFALPRLQARMSVARATLLLGILWAFWHLPAFFYHETYTQMSPWIIPGFIFGVLCGAVLFTWLYNGTGGSIFWVAIWHALYDLLTASAAGQDILPILTSAGVIVWALIVANVEKPWGFRFQKKQTIVE